MAHELMFDDADPYLGRLRTIALALPGAAERISHGSPNFFTQRTFAVFGGAIKGEPYAPRARRAVLVKADPLLREALLAEERFFFPAYVGGAGWVGLSFFDPGHSDAVDWDEVAELVETSYLLTAPARLVREFHQQAGSAPPPA